MYIKNYFYKIILLFICIYSLNLVTVVHSSYIGEYDFYPVGGSENPQYGSPNCTVKLAVSLFDVASLELKSNYDYTTEIVQVSEYSDRINMYGYLNFNVIPNGPPIQVNYITYDIYTQPFQCFPRPYKVSINSTTDLYFENRLLSTRTAVLVQLNISAYYPLQCRMKILQDCVRCTIDPIPPYSGEYNVTLESTFNMANSQCNVTLGKTEFIDLFDPKSGKVVGTFLHPGILFNFNYGKSDIISLVNPNYNGPYTGKPHKSTIIGTFVSSKNTLYSLQVVSSSLSLPMGNVPRFFGFSQSNGNISYYGYQVASNQNTQINNKVALFSTSGLYQAFSVMNNININYQFQSNLDISTMEEFIINANLYSRTSFTLGQSKSFSINYNSKQLKFDYPLGFGPGTLKSYKHSFDYPFSTYMNLLISTPSYQLQSIPQHIFRNTVVYDTKSPILTFIEIKPISLYIYSYTIKANDLSSGIYSITLKEDFDPRSQGTVVLLAKDLIGGSIWNGTFSQNVTSVGYHHQRSYSIILQDRAGNINTYRSESYISYKGDYIPPFPKQVSFNEYNVTGMKLEVSNLNVSITIEMETTVVITPLLSISFFYQDVSKENRLLKGKDVNLSTYQFNTTLPRNYSANSMYFVLHADNDILSTYLFKKLSVSPFIVQSNGYDNYLAPMIGSITSTVYSDKIEYQLTLYCIGQPNCINLNPIQSGYIIIQGEYDPIPKNLTIPATSNSASVTLPFSNYNTCRTQVYRIVGAYLFDGQKSSSSFDDSLMDPFTFFNGDLSSLDKVFTCQNTSYDTTPPVLQRIYTVPSNIILYGNQNASFKVFAVVSDNIGLKDKPTLYLSTMNDNRMVVKPTNVCPPPFLSCTYVYDIKFDAYWGDGNISLSLYGILDQFDNFNGYSTFELSQFNQSAAIINRIYQDDPGVPVPTLPPIVSCTNKCSGNGKCIFNNQCQCNNGFYGPNCEGTVLSIPKPLPNPEEPTVISDPNSNVNLDIQFSELLELDSDKSTIERYPLHNKKWNLETSSNNNTFTYSTKINNETTLYIIIDLTTDERTIEFAGLNITIPPHSIKYTMKLDQYSFKSQLNILQLRMSTAFKSSENLCSSSIDTSSNTKDLEYIKIQYNGKILFGRFVQVSLVDGIPRVATTELIQSTESNGTSFIGINIPNYENQVILDPNFSVLITDDYDKCSSTTPSRLSKGALIGIVVGCAALVVIVIVSSVVLSSSSRRNRFKYFILSFTSRKDKTGLVEMS